MSSTLNAATSGGLTMTSDTSGILKLQTASTDAVTITAAQNVGIGTSSPAQKLSVAGNIALAAASYPALKYYDNSSNLKGEIYYGVGGLDLNIVNYASGIIALNTNGSERMRIDSSGNVGIGVTPSAWYNAFSTQYALQIGPQTALSSVSNYTLLSTNYYRTAAGDKYIGTGNATLYEQNAGAHNWYTAASGTAGNALTFTQAMKLDSSGNLLVGTTTSGGKLTVTAANSTTPMVQVTNTTSGNAAGYASSLQTAANNTSSYHYYGSTLAVGNWYLYGNGTSSWSSDERLKKNITTARDGYLNDLCQLRVVKYQWKNGTDQTELGLIAQEVEQIFPGLVQEDLNPISPDDPTLYKQLKGSVLPFIMLKAIQEQQALITSLTERITALEGAAQ